MRTSCLDKTRSDPPGLEADSISRAALSDLTTKEYVEGIGAGHCQDKGKPGTEASLESRVPGCWCRSPD